MKGKTKVYNGYEEYFMTGQEIKEHFKGCYETFGRHHEKVSSHQINFNTYYKNIKDSVTYRLFMNDFFCRVMDGETDKQVYFFSYTRVKPAWAKD
jgi:hypothetical protein